MFNVSIPKISDEELMKRYSHIKPVVNVKGKLHYLREFSLDEIKNNSYLWKKYEDVRDEVGKDELQIWSGHDFACLHTYGYPGLFKPSIGEVLSQIKDYDVNKVKAFEIIDYPKTKNDFYRNGLSTIIFDNGFHVSTVRLYVAKVWYIKVGAV